MKRVTWVIAMVTLLGTSYAFAGAESDSGFEGGMDGAAGRGGVEAPRESTQSDIRLRSGLTAGHQGKGGVMLEGSRPVSYQSKKPSEVLDKMGNH